MADEISTSLSMRIIELPTLQFTGIEKIWTALQNDDNGICELWSKHFSKKQSEIQPMSVEDSWYGVYRISNEAGNLKEPASFCAAFKTDSKESVPQDCTRLDLPSGSYAFFEFAPGYLCGITDQLSTSIDKAGFAIADNAICFETDAPEGSGHDGTVNIWIPVTQR